MMQTTVDSPPPVELVAAQGGAVGVFLIQHDWAALLDGSEVDSGNYRLPYDYCVFELEVGNRHICALVASADGEPYRLIPLLRVRGGWLIVCSYDISSGGVVREGWPAPEDEDYTRELGVVIMAQVKAVAITLDAEVVRADLVRAPHLSNSAAKRGERQPRDHHVLSLARRYAAQRLGSGGQEPSKRRLHFRRGHWRHYPDHKTWIRWCLVGDPSLGFADKDYRL